MTTAVILSGGVAPYTDPWHPFAETSALLADLLTENGFAVEVSHEPAERLRDLAGVDLLVVNTPSGSDLPASDLPGATPPSADDLELAAAGLESFLTQGGGVLALHVSVTTLLGLRVWSGLMGARWVAGRTMHPPLGAARVQVRSGHPVTAQIDDFELVDELYTHLAIDDELEVLVQHEFDSVDHPLIWAREVGTNRIVADALGHGELSLRSAPHRALLAAAARWATHQL